MNRWHIPEWLEREVRLRDIECIYCRIPLLESLPSGQSRKAMATWEHIINDASIVTSENIARCCVSCNSSKGTKSLTVWLESEFCKRRGISRATLSEVAKRALGAA